DVPRNPLVLGVSVSGTVARVREAANLSRQRGALTVAVTANPSSPLAEASEKVLDCGIPAFAGPHTPGVRSYRMSLLALYLLAIRLGEVRDRYSQDEANAMRSELRQSADAIEATVSAASAGAQELAAEFANHSSFVFVGDGPNYASALFSAAKVIEAAGRHAMGQDTEEWAHLQYFVSVEADTPTFVISPGRRAHDRVAEILLSMARVGRTTVAVTPKGDAVAAPSAKRSLPVAGDVREAFSPMVYAVPGELFSAHLADAVGEPFFRTSNPAYSQGNDIRISRVLEALEA
ncbi:MAG: SIS domain-containing protein, partial [Actinomycetota bacterium]